MWNKVSNFRAKTISVTISKSQPLQSLTVLLVEDKAILAIDIMEELQKFRAKVVGPGRTLAEALQLAENQDITAAILDVNLSG